MTQNKKSAVALRETLRLLEQGWVQKYAAVDCCGNSVNPSSEQACKRCLVGALWTARAMEEDFDILRELVGKGSKDTLDAWNDRDWRTHKEVMDLVREAIAIKEGGE